MVNRWHKDQAGLRHVPAAVPARRLLFGPSIYLQAYSIHKHSLVGHAQLRVLDHPRAGSMVRWVHPRSTEAVQSTCRAERAALQYQNAPVGSQVITCTCRARSSSNPNPNPDPNPNPNPSPNPNPNQVPARAHPHCLPRRLGRRARDPTRGAARPRARHALSRAKGDPH
eukprot:scaffold6373_cov64-Phaeocystis_antarctica.AAC.3